MFSNLVAFAMGGAPGGGSSGGGGSLQAFLPLILMFVIFYFLLIRPQQKKSKMHREMLGNLRKGDRVVTTGGIFGEITGITDTVVTMEIAPKIRIKVARGHVAGIANAGPTPPAQETAPATTEKK